MRYYNKWLGKKDTQRENQLQSIIERNPQIKTHFNKLLKCKINISSNSTDSTNKRLVKKINQKINKKIAKKANSNKHANVKHENKPKCKQYNQLKLNCTKKQII